MKKSALHSTCLAAAGLATAWTAAPSQATPITIDGSLTAPQSLSNAYFLYESNTSAYFSTTTLHGDFAAIPLGNISPANPTTFNVSTNNNSTFPNLDGISYLMVGQNSDNGLFIAGNVSILTTGTGSDFVNDFATEDYNTLLTALGTGSSAPLQTLLEGAFAANLSTSPVFTSLGTLTNDSINFSADGILSTAGTPFDVTLTVLPAPNSAVMSSAILGLLAALRRRRITLA